MKSNKSSSQKSVQSDAIIKIATGFHLSKILFAGVEFDIFTKLGKKKLSAKDVAKKCRLPIRSTTRLLNGAVAVGLLQFKNEKYFNTPVAEKFLVCGKPEYLGDLMKAYNYMLYDKWGNLEEVIKKDKFQPVFGPGKDTIGNISKNSKIAQAAMMAQHSYSVKPAEELAAKFDFSKYNTLLDLGGGSGILSVMAVKKYSHLKAMVFDFPPVCKITRKVVSKYKAGNKVKIHEGNVLQDTFPKGADIILISGVLDGYNESNCRKMIKKAYDYLPNGGGIILKESIVKDDRTGPLFPVLFSLALMIETEGGDSRSRGEMSQWLKETGFKKIRYKALTGISGTFRNLGFVTAVK